jgi:RNA polymerase sigma-70 factor (ECF subfamily)
MDVFPTNDEAAAEQLALRAAKRLPDGNATAAARAAFDLLYQRFSRRILPYLNARMTHDQTEDVHQQTWQRVWQNLPKFDGRSFSGWIFRIAHNCMLETFRRPGPELLHEDAAVVDDRTAVLTGLLAREEAQQLEQCLERLSDREREIFRGRCQGRPHAEIAANLAISEENSQKILSETVAKLRRCVQRAES